MAVASAAMFAMSGDAFNIGPILAPRKPIRPEIEAKV
jgi:hypothetical protein